MSIGYFYEDIARRLWVHAGRNMTFPLHIHMQAELVYIVEGSTFVTIEAKRRRLEAGEAAIVWPGAVHGYETSGESRHVIAIVDPALTGDFREVFSRFHCADPFLSREMVHPDVALCLQALTGDGEIAEPLRRAYLSVALGRITGALPLLRRPAPGGQDALHGLLTYINSHLNEPLTLDSLSRALFLNRHTISKLFSQRVGCGLNTYVNALRVSMAENLLREAQLGVSEIVEKCGFGSERTFYRAFQAQRGTTPGQLRRHIAEMSV